ncbi:DUF4412 domain-containing protein [Mucilaginibacter sp.]|uniref:DUF4412 domain-containing protein n=1 Tax=Mucilaginibacter sp. TaxID=1882438 RepID=UPI003D0970DB
MNIKFFNVALGIVLTATTISASAQKTYTQGVINISTTMQGQAVEAKTYFTTDSLSLSFTAGPATIKILKDAKNKFMAILVDVPVASMKKAAIASPAEIEQIVSSEPKFTFTQTTEAKQISGFNCKKVVATDAKGTKYDVWVTNDVKLPASAFAEYYAGAGGFPVQYTSFSQGQSTSVTVSSVADTKAPAGTFSIAPDFDKITMDDLKAMSGGN